MEVNEMVPEYKPKLILDGNMYKLLLTQDGKQLKISIKSDKDIALMGARRIADEVTELLNARYPAKMLLNMRKTNVEAKRAGYSSRIIKYQTISLDLALRIAYPEDYSKIREQEDKAIQDILIEEPLMILNIGCTAVGKTLFTLRSVLSNEMYKAFVQALTSVKETTACSITYHVNSKDVEIDGYRKFILDVYLKTQDEVKADIEMLVIEAFEEYVDTIRNMVKTEDDVFEIRENAIKAVGKRLELNCDKTFGLGIRQTNTWIAEKVERFISQAMLNYFGNSKTFERLAEKDLIYVTRQLAEDFQKDNNAISNEEVLKIANQSKEFEIFAEIVEQIYTILKSDLETFNEQYGCVASEGECFRITGDCTDEKSAMLLLSHVFGNKKLQRKQGIYIIEAFVKSADIYAKSAHFEEMDREILLADSVGINQGQKNNGRMNEVAIMRVQASVVDVDPDIVIYHTRLDTKDDYLVDIVKNLNAEGYGKVTHVVAGRFDTILEDELGEDIQEGEFEEFVCEVMESYVEKDNVTIKPIIENRYYLCDKSGSLEKKYKFAIQYGSRQVLEMIVNSFSKNRLEQIADTDIRFMNMVEKYYLCQNVYTHYLDIIPKMIPMDYSSMRWNTLQKAIEILYSNSWGFDVLCPALKIRTLIAQELNRKEVNDEFVAMYENGADDIKQSFLKNATEIAQVVLVTEFKTFMNTLLRMRYDDSFRTDFSTSMTNDRKANLQYLYKRCMEQEGLRGEYSMKMVFHMAWLRTVDCINKEAIRA